MSVGMRSVLIDFYPRPPWGGRPAWISERVRIFLFLSTPSVGRATGAKFQHGLAHRFLSTPSVGRATAAVNIHFRRGEISIHALRGEGDGRNWCG